jgi:Ca2+-binding EF-hand superfamily protein
MDKEFLKLVNTVFTSFDKDNSGSIDLNELGAVVKELG